MFAYCVVVLAVCLQVISAQFPPNVPEECRGPPKGVDKPQDCCKLPPFFKAEDLEDCGFEKPEDAERPPKPHGPNGPHHGPPDCSKQLCVMKKYGLEKDGKPDSEAVAAHLDKYAEENEAFKDVVDVAKERCLGKDLPGPPHVCEANKLVFCIFSTLFSNCPTWEQSDSCTNLKEHMEKCKPFFPKP